MGRGTAASLVLLWVGCSFGDLPLDDLRCPCADGWVCGPDEICVPPGDPGVDGALRLDGRVPGPPDGGFALDAGAGLDSGARYDGGPNFDGGPDFDAGPIFDAGPAFDAGPRFDAGVPSSACDDTLATVPLCEGFEDSSLPGWTGPFASDGTVARTTAQAHRGQASLLARSHTAGGRASLRHDLPAVTKNQTDGSLHARVYVFIPSSATLDWVPYMAFEEAASPGGFLSLPISDGSPEALVKPLNATDLNLTSGVSFPTGRFVCVQVAVGLATTSTGSVQVRLDGDLIIDRSGIRTAPATGFDVVRAGLVFTLASQPAVDVYLDELAVDDAPIPCD